MKSLLLSVFALLVLSTPVFAHCGTCGVGDPHPAKAEEAKSEEGQALAEQMAAAVVTPEEKAAKMKEELGLTDEQAAQIKVIMEEKMAKKKEIKDEAGAEMTALREEYLNKLRGVLTSEQFEKHQSMKAKAAEGHEGHKH